jgi:L-aspartate oxidase
MDSYSQNWKDLAPRDVVARAIFSEMLTHNQPNVYLDLRTYISPKRIRTHFPNLYSKCLQYGIDMTKDLVPVVPAAHYHCGGIWVNRHGQTTINNLYAIGEVSRTGLHGANRLASTSLLEGLVWGNSAALHIHQKRSHQSRKQSFTDPMIHLKKEVPDPTLIDQDANLIRTILWNYVGLVRTKKNLTRACADLNYLDRRIERFYRHNRLTESLIGLKNLSLVSRLIAKAALKNTQSAGCHYRLN